MLHGYEPDILFLIGMTILIAFFVGRITTRLGIPQVVGFIVGGLLVGPSVLHVVPLEVVENLDFVSEIALGLIGFEMGLHLHFPALRRLGKSIIVIVLLQAIAPFVLVTGGVWLLTGNISFGLLLGVLATATAPAATVDVLEEYEAKGPLTTSIIAVVGIDDALALIVYSIIVPLVESGFDGMPPSLLEMLEVPFIEIGGSILLGAGLGWPLSVYISRYCSEKVGRVVAMAMIFVCAGLSRSFGLSLILTTMSMGVMIVNLAPGVVDCLRQSVEEAAVVYVLFFALVGARFEVLEVLVSPAMVALAGAYMVLRIMGKYGGSWLGGYLSRSAPVVRDNIGLALLSQAGVAIGLALHIAERFAPYGPDEMTLWMLRQKGEIDLDVILSMAYRLDGRTLGTLVLTVVTATTFVVQLLGPILVKLAITRADEIWKAGMAEA